MKVKALNDYYDDIHYRRELNRETTLCGLKIVDSPTHGDATCLRCRQFATGNF